jgi:2-polyprenyl-3-methyl-5-hydroxy-6-metoxy-1,4-benzoquinol methylase
MNQNVEKYMHWDSMSVQKFWNEKSAKKEDYYSFRHGKSISKIISQNLQIEIPSSEIRVCDYGCGPGYLIDHLLKRNLQVYGIDFSKESVQLMNQRLANYSNFLGCSTLDNNEWKNLKFDIIIVSEVVEHLYDSDLSVLFENISLILAEGGKFIFSTPNNEQLSKSIVYDQKLDRFLHKWQHVRCWTKNSFTGVLNLNGFEVIKAESIDFRYPLLPKLFQLFFRLIFFKRLVFPNLIVIARLK